MTTWTLAFDTGCAAWRVADKARQIQTAVGLPVVEGREWFLPFCTIRSSAGDTEAICEAVQQAFGTSAYGSLMLAGWEYARRKDGYAISVPGTFSSQAAETVAGLSSALVSAGYEVLECNPELSLVDDLSPVLFGRSCHALGIKPGLVDRIRLWFCRKKSGSPHHVKPLLLPVDALRVVLLKGDEIVWSWSLPGRHAGFVGGEDDLRQYRISRGYEGPFPAETGPFVTADQHFGHTGIIDFCARPFCSGDVHTMDDVLTANWNAVVSPDDEVWFLGDLTHKADPATARQYLAGLHGSIVPVLGNHDTAFPEWQESREMSVGDCRFFCVHNPKYAPEDFDGWVLHGHTHNSRLDDYPFLDPVKRTVNVGVEVTGYRPVSVPFLCRVIQAAEAGTLPRRAYLTVDDLPPAFPAGMAQAIRAPETIQ